jgi:hypothetical protein
MRDLATSLLAHVASNAAWYVKEIADKAKAQCHQYIAEAQRLKWQCESLELLLNDPSG